MEGLGKRPWATARCAEAKTTLETEAETRKAVSLLANDKWFKAVAGRPQKNAAKTPEQARPSNEQTASKPERPLAAAGRTAQASAGASL